MKSQDDSSVNGGPDGPGQKTIPCWLIDSEKREIRPHVYNGDYKTIHSAIGCDTFTVATFCPDTGDCAFVDDEGLLKSPVLFFSINGFPQPLAGKGLVLGIDDEGDGVAPTIDLERLTRNVRFYELFGRDAKTRKIIAFEWSAANANGEPKMVCFDDVQVTEELL
jgi:hypothetical protein